jgi:hypothetical protein
MFKFLYSSGLNILLSIFRLFNIIGNIIGYFSYRIGSITENILGDIFGFNDEWYFFDGHTYPIQSKNLNLESRQDATWRYNKRTNTWYPVANYSSKNYFYYPWISGSVFLLTDNKESEGIEFECTTFLNNQKIHAFDENIKDYPYPYHIFGAWCLHNRVSFIEDEIVNMSFNVFTMDAENVSIPIYTTTRKDYEDFFKSIGTTCEKEMVTFESDEDVSDDSTDSDVDDVDEGPDASIFANDVALDTLNEVDIVALIKEQNPVVDMGIVRARQNTSVSEVSSSEVSSSEVSDNKIKNE